MKKGKFIKDSMSSQAAGLVRRGASYAEAAEKIGICWNHVKRACDARGLRQRPEAEWRAFNNSHQRKRTSLPAEKRRKLEQAVLELKAGGLSYSEIGNELSLTRCQVAGIIHRARARKS